MEASNAKRSLHVSSSFKEDRFASERSSEAYLLILESAGFAEVHEVGLRIEPALAGCLSSSERELDDE